MRRLRTFPILTVLVALAGACLAAQPAAQAPPAQGPAPPGSPASAASQGPPKVCIDVEASDSLIKEFADLLRETIAASNTLSLASTTDSCGLQLHVPGNLLRFQTATGVMVSTVVIVTSPSGNYLSTSIAACEASNLKPCAARAVAAAKLALVMNPGDGM